MLQVIFLQMISSSWYIQFIIPKNTTPSVYVLLFVNCIFIMLYFYIGNMFFVMYAFYVRYLVLIKLNLVRSSKC